MKVWLSESEVDHLISGVDDTETRLAIELGAKSGLRSHEVLNVAPVDVVETDAGPILRVHEGKGDKFRQTIIPRDVATRIQTVGDVRQEAPTSPLLSITSTRTLRRWVRKAAESASESDENDPEGWKHLSFHDLRRTWATNLASRDVDPLLVCDWGGWDDLETFMEHYRGTHSPDAQRREREKIDWL